MRWHRANEMLKDLPEITNMQNDDTNQEAKSERISERAVAQPRLVLLLACKTGCHRVTTEEQKLADDLVSEGLLKKWDGEHGETYVPGYSTTLEGLKWIKQNIPVQPR